MRRTKTTPILVLAAALAAHVLILCSAPASRGSPFFFDSEVISGTGCDFFALYVAGDNLRHGRSVYEHEADSAPTPCHFSFRYLPAAAAVGVPFSFLSPRAAYGAWIVLLELLLFVGLYCTWLLTRKKLAVFAPLAALWLCFTPLYLELRLGQFNLVQAVLVMVAATAARLGSGGISDGAFTASLCFKLNTWIAAPSLLKARRYRPLLFASAILLLTSVPHFMVFPGSLEGFISNLQIEGVGEAFGFTKGNLGAGMLLGVFAGDAFSPWMLRALFVAVFAAGLVVTMRSRRMDLAEQLVFWLAISLLAYKHTWEHHYVMVLPALTFLGIKKRTLGFWLAAAVLAMPTPYFFFRGEWLFWQQVVYHAWKPAALLVLVVMMASARPPVKR